MFLFKRFDIQLKRFLILFCSLILMESPLLAQKASLTLEWDANNEEDLLCYKIYWGTVSKRYKEYRWSNLHTKYTITDLKNGVRYYFAVTAVDFWGNESIFSKEVSAIAGNMPSLPSDIELGDNYPNPFNPGTYIDFFLSEKEHVTITVFNSLGQKIRTLEHDIFEAGKHYTFWNGIDEAGQQVAAGIYFYQLEASTKILKKSMILIH